MIKFDYEIEKATRITVDIEGNVQEYALSFLQIFNNAREYPNTLYRVENTYDNRVFVTVNPEYEESAKEFLSQFGKILSVDKAQRVNVYFDYNSKDFDKIYPEDTYTEFFIEE